MKKLAFVALTVSLLGCHWAVPSVEYTATAPTATQSLMAPAAEYGCDNPSLAPELKANCGVHRYYWTQDDAFWSDDGSPCEGIVDGHGDRMQPRYRNFRWDFSGGKMKIVGIVTGTTYEMPIQGLSYSIPEGDGALNTTTFSSDGFQQAHTYVPGTKVLARCEITERYKLVR